MTKLLPLVAICAALAACGGDETEVSVPTPSGGPEPAPQARLSVSDVKVGAAVDGERGVVEEASTFGAGDTVYVSARLDGELDQANIAVRGRGPGGADVGGEERFVPLEGEQVVAFHLAPPAGLAPGDYRVELLLSGQTVGQAEFTVQP